MSVMSVLDTVNDLGVKCLIAVFFLATFYIVLGVNGVVRNQWQVSSPSGRSKRGGASLDGVPRNVPLGRPYSVPLGLAVDVYPNLSQDYENLI